MAVTKRRARRRGFLNMSHDLQMFALDRSAAATLDWRYEAVKYLSTDIT
jgi:hypothetical protein